MKTIQVGQQAPIDTDHLSLQASDGEGLSIHVIIAPAPTRRPANITPLYPEAIPVAMSDEDDLAKATWEDAEWQ